MKIDCWNEKIEKIDPWILIILMCVLPTGSSLRDIFLITSVIFILLSASCRSSLTIIRRSPLAWLSVSLFVLACLGCLWSDATHSDQFVGVQKSIKFIFFPILIAGFTSSFGRRKGLQAYLLTMLVVMIIAVLKHKNVINWFGNNPDRLFNNYIIMGLMMSYAAYIAAWFAWTEKGNIKFVYITLLLLFTYHIFFVGLGRLGYCIYTLLMCLFVLQTLPFRRACVGLLTGAFILGMIVYQSPLVKHRLHQTVEDIVLFKQNNKDTSIGYRLQFYSFSKEIWYRHPLLGNGTGGFAHAFATEKPAPRWTHHLAEPHNQYWYVLANYGLLGIALYAAFLYALVRSIASLREMRLLAVGLLCTFLVGSISESLLFYSSTGVFFITMMALCLGEGVRKRKNGG